MTDRIELPYELQRRADIIKLLTTSVRKDAEIRAREAEERQLWERIRRVIELIRSVINEAIQRQNDEIVKTLIAEETDETLKPLKLGDDARVFVDQAIRIYRELLRSPDLLKSELGMDDNDIRRMRNELKFLESLKSEKYI